MKFAQPSNGTRSWAGAAGSSARKEKLVNPLFIHTAGLCLPRNLGGAALWAWAQFDTADRALASEFGNAIIEPYTFQNRARLKALMEALRWAKSKKHERVIVGTDSLTIVEQLKGTRPFVAKGKPAAMMDAVEEILHSINGRAVWIPMNSNEHVYRLIRQNCLRRLEHVLGLGIASKTS